MRRHAWLTLTLGLALSLLAATTTQSADDAGDLKGAIDKVAAGSGDAAAIAKKNELGEVMHLFKPRNKKGYGVGKPGEVTPDGIELKIIALGKKAPAKGDLSKQADALEELAKRTAAIGDITGAYESPKGAAKNAAWKKLAQDMKASSQDLAKAVKSGDPDKVKVAANKLNSVCNDCHADFRD